MDRELVLQFKKRWDEVNKKEVDELRVASYATHFKQIISSFRLARSLRIADRRISSDEQTKTVRKRWVMLKADRVLSRGIALPNAL